MIYPYCQPLGALFPGFSLKNNLKKC
jgi:hypothetical protein